MAQKAEAADWGTIKGRVVWGSDTLPKPQLLPVEKDKEHCLGKGPIVDESYRVDANSKGLQDVFVYVRFRGKPVLHPDYPQTTKDVEAADKAAFAKLNGFSLEELNSRIADGKVKVADIKAPALIDQDHCVYLPHALAVREGQKIVVLNKEPIAHNVKVMSVSGINDANPIMPANSVQVFEWREEKGMMTIGCNIHGWMKMHAMVFNHPYFAITDAQGGFELKNVPAGEVELLIRHPIGSYIDPIKGGKGTARGAKVKVPAGGVVDLGELKFTAE